MRPQPASATCRWGAAYKTRRAPLRQVPTTVPQPSSAILWARMSRTTPAFATYGPPSSSANRPTVSPTATRPVNLEAHSECFAARRPDLRGHRFGVLGGPVSSSHHRSTVMARALVGCSSLVFIGSADLEGRADVTPRGGPAGFVSVLDERTLVIPDATGNKRLDTMHNVPQNRACRTALPHSGPPDHAARQWPRLRLGAPGAGPPGSRRRRCDWSSPARAGPRLASGVSGLSRASGFSDPMRACIGSAQELMQRWLSGMDADPSE